MCTYIRIYVHVGMYMYVHESLEREAGSDLHVLWLYVVWCVAERSPVTMGTNTLSYQHIIYRKVPPISPHPVTCIRPPPFPSSKDSPPGITGYTLSLPGISSPPNSSCFSVLIGGAYWWYFTIYIHVYIYT